MFSMKVVVIFEEILGNKKVSRDNGRSKAEEQAEGLCPQPRDGLSSRGLSGDLRRSRVSAVAWAG